MMEPRPQSKRMLVVAFHFPPDGGSGTQRTLKFVRYLAELGWDLEVLTVSPDAYYMYDPSLAAEIPASVAVHRVRCWNLQKKLDIAGRWADLLGISDRYVTWLPYAVSAALGRMRARRFNVIYSTSPVRTAHLIGWTLAMLSGVPWVSDFRDPWLGSQPPAGLHGALLGWLERRVLRRARHVIANTEPLGARMCARFPRLKEKLTVLTNGYDEADFAGVAPAPRAQDGRLVLAHTGEVYPHLRDPRPLLEAFRELVAQGLAAPDEVHFRFIGAGPTLESDEFQNWLSEAGLRGNVSVEPHLDHARSIGELLAADVLLLLQCAPKANAQIPAKLFEYLRAERPILAVTPADSATAGLLRPLHAGWVVSAQDSGGLRQALQEVLVRHRSGLLKGSAASYRQFDRREITSRLDRILTRCAQRAGELSVAGEAVETGKHAHR